MTSDLDARVADALGVASVRREGRIQSLWAGYGEVVRYAIPGHPPSRVVVKHVRPPRGRGRSHDRKLRSYEVEQAWYRDPARRCGPTCAVPQCLHLAGGAGEWLFVLEDLDETRRPPLEACLRWLAAFHATFLGERPRGLWKEGTYWHLATRPDELAAMPPGPLRDAAGAIDARLRDATWRTLVHGDAKLPNFCTGRDGRVAAVDFQYVGGGCGMKDVAYLLVGEGEARTEAALDLYFQALREALPRHEADAVEAEWRGLFPWAWADLHRFLAGWAPGWRPSSYDRKLTRRVLDALP